MIITFCHYFHQTFVRISNDVPLMFIITKMWRSITKPILNTNYHKNVIITENLNNHENLRKARLYSNRIWEENHKLFIIFLWQFMIKDNYHKIVTKRSINNNILVRNTNKTRWSCQELVHLAANSIKFVRITWGNLSTI